MKNGSFARFARAVFIFVHFIAVLVLSTTCNDLFCRCVDDVSTKRLIFIFWRSFLFLSLVKCCFLNKNEKRTSMPCTSGKEYLIVTRRHWIAVFTVCLRLHGDEVYGPIKWKMTYALTSFRAVFKWLSKNQNQSHYSDQSQQERTAQWTNHNS